MATVNSAGHSEDHFRYPLDNLLEYEDVKQQQQANKAKTKNVKRKSLNKALTLIKQFSAVRERIKNVFL